jgi:tetratricopeptide (TPR) repeat protein
MTTVLRIKLIILIVSLAGGPVPGSSLPEANRAYERGDYSGAIRLYTTALQKGENPSICYFNRANARVQLDSTTGAIIDYNNALIEAPDFFTARYNLGILYYSAGAYSDAAVQLQQALLLQPDNTAVKSVLGTTLYHLQAYPAATVLLQQALDSKTHSLLFVLADMSARYNDFTEAKEWLQHYPDSLQGVQRKYRLLADMSIAQCDTAEALRYLYSLISLQPDDEYPHLRLVGLLHNAGQTWTALHHARTTLITHRQFASLSHQAGTIALQSGDTHQAEDFFTLSVQQGNSAALVGLTNCRKLYAAHNNITALSRIDELIASLQ